MLLLALRDDLREALRRIRRNPRTTLLAIGTLALGIGAATAVFTMAHTVLLAPPPYRDPGRLVSVSGIRKGRTQGVSGADFLDYRKESGLFETAALAAYAEISWTGQSLPGFDGAEVLRGLVVTADYFRVLDQPMAAGRGFAPDEDKSGHNRVVVISYPLWQRRFGGRSDVIGQTLTLDNRLYTVVGVTGPRFLPYESYEVVFWVPIDPATQWRDSRQYDCFARLAPGISLAQARQRLDAISARLAAAYPDSNAGYSSRIDPFLAQMRNVVRMPFLALVGAGVCLLLIAAANVAALLLARATNQAREMSIRAALGAGRLRLYRMMLAESVILALLASTLGTLLGSWLLTIAKALIPSSFHADWIFTIDLRILVAAFLLSTFAGFLAGLAPALESFRLALGGLRPGFSRSRLLRGIVTAEIALACVLSVSAGLLGKSFAELLQRPLGYNTDHLLGMRIRLTGDRYKDVDNKAAYWSQLLERAQAVPGVAKAANVSDLPMGWQYSGTRFEVPGRPAESPDALPRCHYITASPGYFATVGIPVLAGRGFTEADNAQSEPVAIVSDLLAATAFPGESAIGRQIKPLGDVPRRIVGVVRRIRHSGPQDKYTNEVYVPYRQLSSQTTFLVVRTHVPPESVVPAIRAALRALDPAVPAFEIRSMEKALQREVALPRLPMALTVIFASLAALLAGLGLFGVIAYWVSQRTKELGIRAALGAEGRELRALVLRQGARLAATGLALGLAASLAAGRLLRSLLYGMSERDLSVYAGVVALVALTTLLACWLPAERAARADPASALRDQG